MWKQLVTLPTRMTVKMQMCKFLPFLLNLVSGVQAQKDELDKQINQHLKSGWTVERLTLVEKNLLRLGVFEITSFDTPQLVAVNEAIELAKDFSDQKSARFINGLLSQFVTEEQ